MKDTIEGYASVFLKQDAGGEIVMPGAFKNSIRKRGIQAVKMLFQHNPNMPIGRWKIIREDQNGLFVRGKIAVNTTQGADIMELVKSGAINGLSIGFTPRKATYEKYRKIRKLIEIDLWEISIVTFPMLDGAQINTVKRFPYQYTTQKPYFQ